MKKALASDFDGTLFFPEITDGFLTGDLESIRRFQDEGNFFGICTGRSCNGILVPTGGRIRFDFYILVSGALILDGERHVLYRQCVRRGLLEEIYGRYRGRAEIRVQADEYIYTFREPMPHQVMISSLDDIKGDNLYGISLEAENPEAAAEICGEVSRLFGDEAAAFCNVQNVDVVAKDCSKGNGLRIVKEKLGIDMAAGIGDACNDISMLKAADCSFTFDRSPGEVQKAADHIVRTVEEAIRVLTGK